MLPVRRLDEVSGLLFPSLWDHAARRKRILAV